MISPFEPDGLLNVTELIPDALSYQADTLARRHVIMTGGIPRDVRDFHALVEQYYNKLMAHRFPDVVVRGRL